MRFVLALLWAGMALAERLLETSALLPCQSKSDFSAQKFDIKFYPDTGQADVNVTLASAIDGNFTVDVEVIVYGIKAFTKTVDGCSISDTICPISPGRFDVETNITVPKDYISLPGVAFTMPDIDAVVRAKAYYTDANGQKQGSSIACVEAQLSNGKTVQHSYVSWILFGLIMIGVCVAGVMTLRGNVATAGHIISNTVSLFTYFQATAVIAMMAVHRLPPIAAAWAQNFEWTMGVISVKFMQNVMTWYIRATGGTSTNILPNKEQISIGVYKRSLDAVMPSAKKLALDAPLRLKRRLDLSSNVTTTDETDPNLLGKTLVLQGIKRVSFLANIELSNFFLTGATFFIFIGIAMVVILLLLKLILELLVRARGMAPEKFQSYRANYRAYTKGMMFRYFLVGFTQLSLLCLWEFHSRESVATVIVACIMFAVLLISLSIASAKVIALGRKSQHLFNNPASILFGDSEMLNRWGFLYVQYKASAYYFLLPFLFYNFAKSAVIALGQPNGKVQSVVFFAIEAVYLVVLCVVRPYMDKKTNGFNIAISVFSVINAIFFMFFSQLFGEKVDVASSIIGVVYFIMNLILTVVFLIIIIVACIWAIFHPHPDARYQPVTDDRNLFMPDNNLEKATELDDLGHVAQDGYRHSNLILPNEHPSAGIVYSPDPAAPAPQAAMRSHNYQGFNDEGDFQSYRDIQSRGILGQQNPTHDSNERLL